MSSHHACHQRSATHTLNQDSVFLDVSVRVKLRDHGGHRVLCKRAAKIRWPCRTAVSRLGDSHRQVSAAGKLVQHAPFNKVLSARSRPFLMPVQKDNCGPRSVAFRFFQKIFHLLRRIIRVGNREGLGFGDLMSRTGNQSNEYQQQGFLHKPHQISSSQKSDKSCPEWPNCLPI